MHLDTENKRMDLHFFCRRSTSSRCGDVAQLGERYVRNVQVVGSNPIISTMKINFFARYRSPYANAS